MKIIRVAVLLIVLSVLIGCNQKNEWYDYGNGVVNLSNISHIRSDMSFKLVLTEKEAWGINKEVILAEGAITEENIEKVRKGMIEYKDEWESVSSKAAIIFDLFTVQLHTFDSAKVPVTDEGCVKLVELWLAEYNKLVKYLAPHRS